jgi:hypothetical protein
VCNRATGERRHPINDRPVNMSNKWVVEIALAALMSIDQGASRTLAAAGAEVIVASGTLNSRFLARALFHIGEFWIRVPSDTEFNRWLSQGVDRKATIRLVTDPARFADAKGTRILSGTLKRGTAPDPNSSTVEGIGRLPEGDSPVVNVLFLQNELTGGFNAITFETADLATAMKFDPYNDKHVDIVIELK